MSVVGSGSGGSPWSPQSMRAASGSRVVDGLRLWENESHAQDMKASRRARVPLSSQAWTPSQALKAMWPWSSWRWGPISATAAPWPIMAMIPLSW